MRNIKILFSTLFAFLISQLSLAQDLSWSVSEGFENLNYTGTSSSLSHIMVVNERVFIVIRKSSNFDKLLYSDDNGVTWVESGLTTANFFPVMINAQQSDTMYAYGLTSSFALGIAKSTDLGITWNNTVIESGVSGNFEFFAHNSGKLLMAGRSPDLILSTDGGATWNQTNSINETDEVVSIRNVFSFGEYFFAQGNNSNGSGAKGLYRMHVEETTWTFLGDTTNMKDDNNYTLDTDVVFDEENQRIIMLWENPFRSGGEDDKKVLAYTDDFGDTWSYKTKEDLGDPEESGEYEELAIRGNQLMIVVSDGIHTGGNRVIAVDKNLTSSGYVNTTSDFDGLQDENRVRLLKANSTTAFGYRELNDPYRKMLFTYPAPTGVSNEEESIQVEDFQLSQNYPNPFNPATVISYQLPANSLVSLKVYDLVGREVATLVDARMSAGSHTVNFDASRLSSGMYIYRLQAGNNVQTRKMLLVK